MFVPTFVRWSAHRPRERVGVEGVTWAHPLAGSLRPASQTVAGGREAGKATPAGVWTSQEHEFQSLVPADWDFRQVTKPSALICRPYNGDGDPKYLLGFGDKRQ